MEPHVTRTCSRPHQINFTKLFFSETPNYPYPLNLLLTLRFVPLSLSLPHPTHHSFPAPKTANSTSAVPKPEPEDQCSSGRVFVYDLPENFNLEILAKCDRLNPWSSRCDAMANGGLGPIAIGLSGIVPENLVPAWYWTDQFVSEIVFHNRMLKHKCRVLEPESATAFYIPFYAGLAVGKYLWSNSTAEDCDLHYGMMLKWVQDQPYFKRSDG